MRIIGLGCTGLRVWLVYTRKDAKRPYELLIVEETGRAMSGFLTIKLAFVLLDGWLGRFKRILVFRIQPKVPSHMIG